MRGVHLLTNRKYEKFLPPPPIWTGRVSIGGKGGVIPVGGYMLAVDVGCGVGLCWNMGEACRSGSHICGNWYFPRFLFRGVLHADEQCFLDGPRLHVNFLMYNAELLNYNGFTLFTAVPVLFTMYTNKDSNLISELHNCFIMICQCYDYLKINLYNMVKGC